MQSNKRPDFEQPNLPIIDIQSEITKEDAYLSRTKNILTAIYRPIESGKFLENFDVPVIWFS